MTYWAQLLHLYQPPTQTHDVLRKVTEESYRPLIAVLREHPAARLAVNMSGVLTEMLIEHGMHDVVDGFRGLAEHGQVEFVGSGKFHPILPLIPEAERRRSIAENARANAAAFGSAWKPRGFFPPEMCYSAEMLPAVASAGHDWVVLSGVSCPGEWTTASVYRTPVDHRTMHVLFRDDVRSNRISFRETDAALFIDDLARVGAGEPAYVLTAMDAETYGHHIKGWERTFLDEVLTGLEQRPAVEEEGPVEMVLPSDLLSLFPNGPVVEPLPSSWSTSRDDIAAHNPYPLWNSPENPVHRLQWEYVNHCLALLAVARRYAGAADAKAFAQMADERLQPALHSCQFWWASRRPMWDVAMIHRGLMLLSEVLVYAARSIELGTASEEVKREASWRWAAANAGRAQIEQELAYGAK